MRSAEDSEHSTRNSENLETKLSSSIRSLVTKNKTGRFGEEKLEVQVAFLGERKTVRESAP